MAGATKIIGAAPGCRPQRERVSASFARAPISVMRRGVPAEFQSRVPMIDTFKRYGRSLTAPPEDATELLPDDEALLFHVTRALYVGGSGDVRVKMLGGAAVTFANVPAGSLIPLRVVQLLATGTTATGIVGLW